MESKRKQLQDTLDDPVKLAKTAVKAFEAVDKDKSGKLDVKEMKECLTTFTNQFKIPSPSDEQVEELLGMLDTGDKDGLISKSEFTVLMQAFIQVSIDLIDSGVEF